MRRVIGLCVLALCACSSGAVSGGGGGGAGGTGGGGTGGGGGGAIDSGTDAGSTDAGFDGGFDAGIDDGGTDAGLDAGTTDGGTGWTALPCTVHVGSGSGTFTIDSTVGSAGDVICLAPGSYSGGSITGVSHRVIQNDGALVTVTGVVTIGNLSDVTLSGSGDPATPYGFLFTGAQATMQITGPNDHVVFHDLEAIGAGILLDAGHTNLVWSGSTSQLVLYQALIDRIHLKQSGQLFQGNYGAPSMFTNFASDVEMSNVIVEDSIGTGQNVVAAGGLFNLNAHDWTITGHNTVVVGSGDDRDVGVFSIVGSGALRRIHRVGGWGWLIRNFGASLGPNRGEFYCENNVDIGTEYYGTCEVRTDNTATDTYLVPGMISTIDVFIRDNVSGHKLDIKGGYTTAIGLIPYLAPNTTATLTGNVGCDNAQDYGDMDSLHFFQVDGTVVKSNNQQLTSCTGVIDPITGQPL
ncbi:MAG: hypothetical protein QM723_14920 [Myxococcaceae bacterium]